MPTLWDGRLGGGADEALRKLNDSLGFDKRLYREDIAGSRAHVRMLGATGIIPEVDAEEIVGALDEVEAELSEGRFTFDPSDEDIHTAIERRVTELVPAGAKLHTGRSRNDQVATDMRLFTRRSIDEVVEMVRRLQATLLDLAENAGQSVLPGFTHLQRAQPVTLGHYLLSHGWALQRDVERLRDTRKRLNVSPLGAGAIAGTSLPIDVEMTARELGFDTYFDNSIDAVEDRDFVAEVLFDLALLGTHLSRLSEDIVIWNSTEFSYLRLDDSFATGSSMMPQKKNPDVAEVTRGKTGRLVGNLTSILVVLKGLPTGYNKDLQEDKEALFDSFDTVSAVLPALCGTLETATFNVDSMGQAAADPLLAATDLAEWLVGQGTPFREAHRIVADLVRRSSDGEGELADLVSLSPDLGPDAAALLTRAPGSLRNSHGSGAPDSLSAQLDRFRKASERP